MDDRLVAEVGVEGGDGDGLGEGAEGGHQPLGPGLWIEEVSFSLERASVGLFQVVFSLPA